MKHLISGLIMLSAAAVALSACAGKKEQVSEAPQIVKADRMLIGGATAPTPKAVAYKTNGDYRQNVTIQVDSQGKIISYPAPSDVRGMEPVQLVDGWLLSRRGVSAQTVFTRYTYAEYAALKQAPSLDQLKAAIIPGARITETVRLNGTVAEVMANPEETKKFLLGN